MIDAWYWPIRDDAALGCSYYYGCMSNEPPNVEDLSITVPLDFSRLD